MRRRKNNNILDNNSKIVKWYIFPCAKGSLVSPVAHSKFIILFIFYFVRNNEKEKIDFVVFLLQSNAYFPVEWHESIHSVNYNIIIWVLSCSWNWAVLHKPGQRCSYIVIFRIFNFFFLLHSLPLVWLLKKSKNKCLDPVEWSENWIKFDNVKISICFACSLIHPWTSIKVAILWMYMYIHTVCWK